MGNVEGAKRDKGFNWYSTADQVTQNSSLQGKNVIVTGSNSGIGKETARVLAKIGANVILAVRNQASGEEALNEIRAQHQNAHISLMSLDLSSLASVRKFAHEFKARNEPLHILICNAGVMAMPYTETADGHEMQLGTNHLGHFLLVRELLPCLIEGGTPEHHARVVVLSSAAHRQSPMHLEDLSGKNTWYTGYMGKWTAYGQSKTANILFAVELNRQCRERNLPIDVNALHPGAIRTNLQKNSGFLEKVFFDVANPLLFKTVQQGAATSVYVATSPNMEGSGGKYYSDSSEAVPKPYAIDPEVARKLWEISEKIVDKTVSN